MLRAPQIPQARGPRQTYVKEQKKKNFTSKLKISFHPIFSFKSKVPDIQVSHVHNLWWFKIHCSMLDQTYP